MRVEQLVAPNGDDELWDLEPEALRLRPYMTGDVFADVDDGAERPVAVMIVGHPCVIRGSAGQLARRVPSCVVKQMQDPLPYERWPEARFDRFPIPPSNWASITPPTCSSGAASAAANYAATGGVAR